MAWLCKWCDDGCKLKPHVVRVQIVSDYCIWIYLKKLGMVPPFVSRFHLCPDGCSLQVTMARSILVEPIFNVLMQLSNLKNSTWQKLNLCHLSHHTYNRDNKKMHQMIEYSSHGLILHQLELKAWGFYPNIFWGSDFRTGGVGVSSLRFSARVE